MRNQAQILKCLHVALDGAGRLPELPCQPCCSNRFIFGVILRDTKRQQFIDKSLSFSLFFGDIVGDIFGVTSLDQPTGLRVNPSAMLDAVEDFTLDDDTHAAEFFFNRRNFEPLFGKRFRDKFIATAPGFDKTSHVEGVGNKTIPGMGIVGLKDGFRGYAGR